MPVDMEDVLQAFGRPASAAHTPYLDLESGDVIPVADPAHAATDPEDMDDAEASAVRRNPRRYREVPRIAPHEEVDLMREFVQGLEDATGRLRLMAALQSGRPQWEFQRELRQEPGLGLRWEWWRQQAHLDEAVAWLHMLGIDPAHSLLEGPLDEDDGLHEDDRGPQPAGATPPPDPDGTAVLASPPAGSATGHDTRIDALLPAVDLLEVLMFGDGVLPGTAAERRWPSASVAHAQDMAAELERQAQRWDVADRVRVRVQGRHVVVTVQSKSGLDHGNS